MAGGCGSQDADFVLEAVAFWRIVGTISPSETRLRAAGQGSPLEALLSG